MVVSAMWIALGCVADAPPLGPVIRAPDGWLKGQTHAHSSGSADSRTPPEQVARWYAERGYDFLVLTDHERVTEVPSPPGLLVLRGVELTQNLDTCDPPSPNGCQLHLNALFVAPTAAIPWAPPTGDRRIERYQRALDVTRVMGGVPQLNHPNYHYAADAGLIAELGRRGLGLLEVANQSGVANEGDAAHPSTEALWDEALSAGVTLFGVASDDAHHYADAEALRARGQPAYTGDLGWIVVRAERDPDAIREAVVQGRFYATTGVVLTRVEVDGGELVLEADAPVGVRFVGLGGVELGRAEGQSARFPLADLAGGYVRAVVTDDDGHHAWTQAFRP